MKVDAKALYEKLKAGGTKYDEEIHCELLLKIMADVEKSRLSAFCVEVGIGESTFYDWVKRYPIFALSYALGKALSRENWEEEGRRLKDKIMMPGTTGYSFEYWRMVGWSRFGIGKTCKIKLDLDPQGKPTDHYSQLIKQANNGEFTASEIKQLMEALSLGLKTQQTVDMQKEIDDLKADLITMAENSNGNNSFADKRAKKKD